MKKEPRAFVIMLNNTPKLVVISVRSIVSPMMSKMRTEHFKSIMKDNSMESRTKYRNTFHWHIEEVPYLIKDYRVDRGKKRVDRH